jgi:hypothetical protein
MTRASQALMSFHDVLIAWNISINSLLLYNQWNLDLWEKPIWNQALNLSSHGYIHGFDAVIFVGFLFWIDGGLGLE